jgi:hypothetical protein
MVCLHQKASHHHRINTLAGLLGATIARHGPTQEQVKCLDIGCGDMSLAETIQEQQPQTAWTCIDIHPLPEDRRSDPRWAKYQQFDGCHIDAPDRSFRFAQFVDVLHHIPSDLVANLSEAARVADLVLVKDHLEYSLYSRTMLQLMDVVGNWGYDISIPRRYFNHERLTSLVKACGLEIVELNIGLHLYRHNALLNGLLRPSWQFIAVLRKA